MNASTLKATDLAEITWQGVSEYTTQRGRVKAILTGIPGSRFWYSWKHHAEFREQLSKAQITIHRLERGKWEVCLWINHRNAHLVQDLGYTVPEIAPKPAKSEQPF